MNTTKVTSQGTISLPVTIRRKLGVQPGDELNVSERSGEIIITIAPDIKSLREYNKKFLKKNLSPYKSGDGFRAHVNKKYGTQ